MKRISYLLLIIWLSSCSDKELEQLDKTLYESTTEEVDAIIDPIESMPEFVGGTEALLKYLKQNNQYFPQNVTVKGRVFVSFIVTETGKITDVQIVKGLNEPCNKEALRMVENMPAWIPAEQMGRNVSTKMILPIRFNM